MKVTIPLITLAAVASAYASCTGLPTGSTDTVSTQFTLSSFDATSGTTSPLHLLIAFTQPGTSYHILAVSHAFLCQQQILIMGVWTCQSNSGNSAGFPGFTMASGALTTTAAPPPNQNLALAHYLGLEGPPTTTSIFPTAGPWPLFANSFSFPSGVFCSVVSIQTSRGISSHSQASRNDSPLERPKCWR